MKLGRKLVAFLTVFLMVFGGALPMLTDSIAYAASNQVKVDIKVNDKDTDTQSFQIKLEWFDGIVLFGAWIGSWKSSGHGAGTYNITADNQNWIKDLDGLVIYRIKEITPLPNGYSYSSINITGEDEDNCWLDGSYAVFYCGHPQTFNVTIKNTRQEGSLKVVKYETGTTTKLPGATFQLSSSTAFTNPIERTTGSTGEANFDNLLIGTYYLRESGAPTGYLNDNATGYRTITITNGCSLTENYYDRKNQGAILIEAKDSQDHSLPVVGATFTINGSGSYTTNASGQALVSGLTPGNYTVTQTGAPGGYKKDGTSQTAPVTVGGTATCTFYNDPTGIVRVYKKDTNSGANLQGAVFAIATNSSFTAGTIVATLTTGAGGYADSSALVCGTYYIKETAEPGGYVNDNGAAATLVVHQSTAVTAENTYTYYDRKNEGAILIEAKDSQNHSLPVAGAMFTVNGATYTTNASGQISIPGLTPGNYTVTQTDAPGGYKKDSTSQTAPVTVGGTATCTFYNDPTGIVRIIKEDADTHAKLAGVTFAISATENFASYVELTTNGDGYIDSSALVCGTYYIKETNAATGYVNDHSAASTIVVHHSTAATPENTYTYRDRKNEGALQVVKTDSQDGLPMAGVSISISGLSGTFTGATDTNGQVTFEHLLPGDYTVTEVTPAGYKPLAGSPSGTVEVGGTAVVNIANVPVTRLTMNKIVTRNPADTSAIPTFHVRVAKGGSSTDYGFAPDSPAVIDDIAYGTYEISEVVEYDNYTYETATKTVTIDRDHKTGELSFTNTKLYGTIEVTKTFKAGTPAPAAGTEFVFSLYEGGSKIGASQTLAWSPTNNKITFAADNGYLLEFGHTYRVVESDKYGYDTDDAFAGAGYSVAISSVDTYPLSCENEKLFGKVQVTKALAGGVTDDTATFVFYLKQGDTVIRTSPAIKAGHSYTFENLEYGEYTISEAPSMGFSGSPSFTGDIKFLTADRIVIDSTATKAVTCTNTKLFGSIGITKVLNRDSLDTTPIPDFEVEIVGPSNNPNALSKTQRFTVHNGDNTISGLEYGDYTISEAAQAGYRNDSISSGSFTVDGDDTNDIVVTITNTKLYGSIEVTKKFTAVDAVDGAQFTFRVIDAATNVQAGADKTLTWASGGDNKITFAAPDYLLQYGQSYKVVELPAPGYDIDTGFAAGYPVTINSALDSLDCSNTRLGTITVAKEMAGDYVAAPEFEFTISGPSFAEPETFKLTPGTNKQFKGLADGEYTITEAAKDGFELTGITGTGAAGGDARSYVIDVDNGSIGTIDHAATFTNSQLGKLQLVKKDADDPGRYLGGAVFRVTSADDPTVTFELTTSGADDETLGKVTSGWLPQGDYTVEEITPPAGYHIDDSAPRTLTVTAGGTASETFTDSLGSVLVYKRSSYGDRLPLAGVIFQLLRSEPAADGTVPEGDIVGTATTGAGGIARFDRLPIGNEYWVREIQQAPNYDIDKLLSFKVTASFEPEAAGAVFENNPLGTVQVTKTDAADPGKKLAGAVFGIYSDSECKTLVQTMPATGAEGIAASEPLPFGGSNPAAYYVKEITPPAGYLPNAAAQPVTFTEAGQVVHLDFGNTRNVGSLVIKKVDALDTTKALAGAQFKLYTSEAMTMQVGAAVTTDTRGIARFDGLTPGNYWLMETVAPTNYDLPTEPLPVAVTAGVTDPEPFEIQNQYNPPEDIATGMMDWNVLLIGSLALLAGLLLVVFSRRRRMQPRAR